MRFSALAAATLLLAGCPIGNNKYPKPSELSPSWYVDRLRVLAVRADPPEVAPGEEVRFEALVVHPNDKAGVRVWLACPPDDAGGIGFGCTIDPSFDFASASAEELEEAGFIGFEPLIPPRYTPPLDLLEGLSEAEASEGVYVLVQIAVLPSSVLTEGFEGDSIDFNDVEAAYKRLVVSEASTPNNNPAIVAMSVDGVEIPSGTVVELDRDQPYEIGARLAEGSVETYTYLNRDGDEEQRTEEPYVHWYADGGAVEEEVTLFPYLEATWRSPVPEDGKRNRGTIWAVVRDRRGGMAWASLDWRIRGTVDPTPPTP